MGLVNVTINGEQIAVQAGTSILNAAKLADIHIPTLCHHEDLEVKANCRVCVAEVKGMNNLQATCLTKVSEGMKVETRSKRVREKFWRSRGLERDRFFSEKGRDCIYNRTLWKWKINIIEHIIRPR